MEINRRTSGPRVLGSLLGVTLIATCVFLSFAVHSFVTSADQEPYQATREYLLRMAALGAVLLVVIVMLLGVLAVRFVVRIMTPSKRPESTSQVSAWEEAGKRFKLDEDDPD